MQLRNNKVIKYKYQGKKQKLNSNDLKIRYKLKTLIDLHETISILDGFSMREKFYARIQNAKILFRIIKDYEIQKNIKFAKFVEVCCNKAHKFIGIIDDALDNEKNRIRPRGENKNLLVIFKHELQEYIRENNRLFV